MSSRREAAQCGQRSPMRFAALSAEKMCDALQFSPGGSVFDDELEH
jgi:hypothetical protein